MELQNNKTFLGTKEWASSNINLISGCSHDCRYCYGKKLAIRFNRKTEDTWKIMELNEKSINKNYKKRKGRIMFPSSHDIVPEFKEECFDVLEKLLKVGNSLLITSKPHFDVIKELCIRFKKYKNLIQFRFTITSINNELLRFWEPYAPLFEERLKSLKFAYSEKYKTSVSIEPFLDKNPLLLIKTLYPYVSETIWLGKMNYITYHNLSIEESFYYKKIRENYSFQNIENIVNLLKRYKKIRYKDSIKNFHINTPIFQIPQVKK